MATSSVTSREKLRIPFQAGIIVGTSRGDECVTLIVEGFHIFQPERDSRCRVHVGLGGLIGSKELRMGNKGKGKVPTHWQKKQCWNNLRLPCCSSQQPYPNPRPSVYQLFQTVCW